MNKTKKAPQVSGVLFVTHFKFSHGFILIDFVY